MKKVSTAISEIITENPLLQLGLQQRILNLSQTARFIQSQVETRSGRSIELAALTMALSRIQKELDPSRLKAITFPRIHNMTVYSNLLIRVYPMSATVRKSINALYAHVQGQSSYITVSEGMSEVSVITSNEFADSIEELFPQTSIYSYDNVSSLAMKFGPSFFETAGVFHTMVQQLYFQNINILEMASAGTEFILYLEDKDIRLAFDTIYNKMAIQA